MKRSILIAAVLMMFGAAPALAQRQTPGRPSVDGFIMLSSLPGGRFGFTGGGAFWSSYRYSSRVSWGAEVSTAPLRFIPDSGEEGVAAEEQELLGMDITAGGGWYYRLLAPRSRVVILSAGIGGFAGIRHCPRLGDFSVAETGFVLNVVPEVLLEVFPLRTVPGAISVSFRPRMTVFSTGKGNVDWFRPYLGVGFKYYL